MGEVTAFEVRDIEFEQHCIVVRRAAIDRLAK
jgi:hypothetical protein